MGQRIRGRIAWGALGAAGIISSSCAKTPMFVCGTWEHPPLAGKRCDPASETAVVNVTVADAAGAAIPGASVYMLPMGRPAAEVRPVLTDDLGHARLELRETGVHAVLVLLSGFFPQTRTILLEAGCTGSLPVTIHVATGPQ